jgi:ABC-type Zn uptake system ZnuABC Zn-binding protein ZnuA
VVTVPFKRFALVVATGCLFFTGTVSGGAGQKAEVLCTTSHLESAVQDIAGSRVRTRTLIPFGMCPGHFDVTPGEARGLHESGLLLYHGYERFIEAWLEKAPRGVRAEAVRPGGHWMIPENRIRALDAIAGILSRRFPEDAAAFRDGKRRALAATREASRKTLETLRPFENTPVVCSVMNEEYVRWMGFNVTGVFPRDEALSARTLMALVSRAKNTEAALIIDNLQSSGKTAPTLAREIKAPSVVISNFPGPGDGGRSRYLSTLAENTRKIAAALSRKAP